MAVASSAEREALAQAGMDAFNEGNMARMLAVLSEDVVVYASPEMVNSGEFNGHDGFVSWIDAWTDAWEQVSADVRDNEAVGERHVVISVHQQGRGRGGIEVSMDLAFLFDVDEAGRCTFLAMVPTTDEALAMAEERERSA
jgi:hypothetical protein